MCDIVTYVPGLSTLTSLSQPPSAATCDPRNFKQSTSSNGSPFTITCIRSPFTIPGAPHKVTLTYVHSLLSSFAFSTKLTHQSTQQTSTPIINVAARVCALATKAVKFGQQRLCFLNKSTNSSCICLHIKNSKFSSTNRRSIKIIFRHNLIELSNFSFP